MKKPIFKAVKETPNSNTIVKEINANVATLTFPGKGIFKADLYHSRNSASMLVYAGSCAPVNDEFAGTYEIEIK